MAAFRIHLACFLCGLCVLCTESAAEAQITIGAEYDRDRFTYHFDNPSTFDTAALVPHFFEQRYDADNLWLIATARYRAGIPFETSGGLTPSRDSSGDDYDTFFDPDGSVIVSGTTGPISIRSWRIKQQADIARRGPLTVTTGYRLRVDRSDFGVGHKTVVRNGVTVQSFDITTPEFTSSQMHEWFGGIRTGGFEAEFAPVTLGRLLVQLPVNYPGQDLIFYAKAAAGSASFTLSRSHLSVRFAALRTWNYSSSASLSRNTIAIRLSISSSREAR